MVGGLAADPLPPLMWSVRILLECILVILSVFFLVIWYTFLFYVLYLLEQLPKMF